MYHQHHQYINAMKDILIDDGYSRTVSYVNKNHFSLIIQKWGSVNRKVLPFCIANVLLTLTILKLLQLGIDVTISEFGHEFMSILVSFLVINKLSFSLGLYYELQGYLSKLNQSTVEVVQLACSLTKESSSSDERYKQWRLNITLQSLALLKSAVNVIYKGGEQKNVWETIPNLDDSDDHGMLLYVGCGDNSNPTTTFQHDSPGGGRGSGGKLTRRRSQVRRQRLQSNEGNNKTTTPFQQQELLFFGGGSTNNREHVLQSDLNLRVPIRVAQNLRETILEHRKIQTSGSSSSHQPPQVVIDSIHEQMLLNCVKEFLDNYYGIRKYLVCPLPLPLVQLGRIFVIFYVFTLPFALLSPDLKLKFVQMIMLILLITYGFIGIELLFVEIDDPFAEDPNDLPLIEESNATYEDILLSLQHVDGQQAVNTILERFNKSNNKSGSTTNYYDAKQQHDVVSHETDSLV